MGMPAAPRPVRIGGMNDLLTVDDLTFAIRWSRRRRSIGIAVDRGGALTLAVPVGCSRRRLEAAVRGKLPWVRRKIGEMVLLGPPPAPPTFADGESLPYLGRRHRVLSVEAPKAPVRLHRGRFEIDRALGLLQRLRRDRAALVARARAAADRRLRHRP
jgi:predicted metal-dependent hydrolase